MQPHATAVVQQGQSLAVAKVTLPKLEAHQVYVKVEIAAFNPTDRLAFDLNAFGDGAVLGCDFAGTVVQVHPSVTKLAIGDRTAALVWGGEIKGLGAYSSYCIADERIAFKIPEGISISSASSVPLAANTAYLALFSSISLGLPKIAGPGQSILVWGGSCNPRNFDRVKRAGATYVFDYADPDVASKICAEVADLFSVFDAIGNASSSTTAARAIRDSGGVLCTVRPGRANTQGVPETVRVRDVFVFTAFPTPHSYRGAAHWPVIMENHLLSVELNERLPQLLSEGTIMPPPVENMDMLGPETLQKVMDINRAGKSSFRKLYFEVTMDPRDFASFHGSV